MDADDEEAPVAGPVIEVPGNGGEREHEPQRDRIRGKELPDERRHRPPRQMPPPLHQADDKCLPGRGQCYARSGDAEEQSVGSCLTRP
jgi:hypothetical protein